MNNYDGGKNGDGVYQRIINLIPPHETWIEVCAGSASITRRIRPASQSFVIESEPLQAGKLKEVLRSRAVVINTYFQSCIGLSTPAGADTFIFADPPYLKSVRTYQRDLYKVEWLEDDHREFLWWLKDRKEMIMVTHPVCDLYLSALQHWNRVEYEYMSRNGLRSDCIWYNYPTPDRLHDYTYAGRDRTERQRIKRKINREITKLAALPGVERNAIIEAVQHWFNK